MKATTEEIVRFARCLATGPTKRHAMGWKSEALGDMPCGTRVWAHYYNWDDDPTTLTFLSVWTNDDSDIGLWYSVGGYFLDPPVHTT